MADEPKYKIGTDLFLATKIGFFPVKVKEVLQSLDSEQPYIVTYQNITNYDDEVLENDLYENRLDAIRASLEQNDSTCQYLHEQIRDDARELDRLHDINRRLRDLMYEEQIMKYMKDRNEQA